MIALNDTMQPVSSRIRRLRWIHAASLCCALLVLGLRAIAETFSVPLGYVEATESFATLSFSVQQRTTVFSKEPIAQKQGVERGTLTLAGYEGSSRAFLWDPAGKIYIDQNGNEDLADDGPGFQPASSYGSGRYSYCTFTNVAWPVSTNAAAKPIVLDLNMNLRGGQVQAYARLKSYWSGKIELGGEEWEIGVAPKGERGKARHPMILRPWAERGVRFSAGETDPASFPMPEHLLVRTNWFKISWAPDPTGASGGVLELAPQPVILGEVAITGEHVRCLVLQSESSAAVLYDPQKLERLPVGSYGSAAVQLGTGEGRAFRSTVRNSALRIEAGKTAALGIGGPLTNVVTVDQHGAILRLQYKLAGADGAEYAFVDRAGNRAATFKIMMGDREVHAGNFEYG